MNRNWTTLFLLACCLAPAPSVNAETIADRLEFKVKDHTAFVLLPPDASKSEGRMPWVWYAPTLSNRHPSRDEKWMFDRLHQAGIAVAGIDVGESYGSPNGRDLYQAFYEHLTDERGFHYKPVLLARSRGGLMLYSWAIKHPESVAAIAGIYPVCNIASYPGVEKAAAAYELTATELESKLADLNPVEQTRPLAQRRVPILHIQGDSDRVVPHELNSGLLATRYQEQGGPIDVVLMEGQGHNMWRGWFESQRLVDFMIKHAHPWPSDPKHSLAAQRFVGRWALKLPNGGAGWLAFYFRGGTIRGELWTVGEGRAIADLAIQGETLHFSRNIRIGKPDYQGGPPTGPRVPCNFSANATDHEIEIKLHRSNEDSQIEDVTFFGKRMPPLPPKPELDQVKFGAPIKLFNETDLEGWVLTDPNQVNGWKAIDGELVNETEKLDFSPFSKFGNLRTVDQFEDFNLKIEFNVPKGGNSGIYLRGIYEVQVLDRDSRMQGIQGVGAVFGRIKPSENAGTDGGVWNQYDITLVDRHITVILNGKKVIDNQPVIGCTNGALHADETIPGPIYLQGDHTSVRYRNIVLRPVIEK